MAINDYLQGISNYTAGQKADVKTATSNLASLQEGAGGLEAKLKEALNTKLNDNRDIIEQQADTMSNYFQAPSAARVKYQDVWNPFEREKLVAKDRALALRPYDVLTNVLDTRMGEVSDIVDSGISGWKGLVDAASTLLSSAQNSYSGALSEYGTAASQQQAADSLALEVAKANEQARQFELTYGLSVQQFEEGVRQFNISEANRMKISGRSGSGSNGTLTSKDIAANTKEMQDELRKIISEKGVAAGWAYISGSESALPKYGVDANDLWSIYKAAGGSSVPPTTNSSSNNSVSIPGPNYPSGYLNLNDPLAAYKGTTNPTFEGLDLSNLGKNKTGLYLSGGK